jgi:hypothetical protein
MTKVVSVPEEAITHHYPDGPVVYFLMQGEECVYVGSSKSLTQRLPDHLRKRIKRPEWTFDSVRYIHVDRSMMLETERYWIKEIQPKLNVVNIGRPRRGHEVVAVGIRLPVEIYQQLKRLAEKLGTSIQDQENVLELARCHRRAAAEVVLHHVGTEIGENGNGVGGQVQGLGTGDAGVADCVSGLFHASLRYRDKIGTLCPDPVPFRGMPSRNVQPGEVSGYRMCERFSMTHAAHSLSCSASTIASCPNISR